MFTLKRDNWMSVRKFLLGTGTRSGFISKLVLFVLLVDVGLIYLYPFFHMISTMLMSTTDLIDPTIIWIPRSIHWDNLAKAFEGLQYWQGFGQSMLVSLVGAGAQAFSCALAGYGFARYDFPGKNVLFFLVLLTFVIPPQTIVIPLFLIYRKFGWLDTQLPLIVPEMLGLGLKGALFIVIYRQFFMGLPASLEEAARLDGASPFGVFTKVMLPLAKPAILSVSLFSFVWHWNDFYLPTMFVTDQAKWTLVRRLSGLQQSLDSLYDVDAYGLSRMTEPVNMAGAFLVIMPVLLLYLVAQRWFTESIERTGLVE